MEPGARVGRYVVGERLGAGGMGAVYSAFDPELDRRVAIKVLHERLDDDDDVRRARMAREAQAMARLQHPNVVTVYDVGIDDEGRVFVAMELVDGGTVRRWLSAKPRAWREVVALFRQAAEGLAAAHRAGIVHRDFKPDNVLVDASGRPRVTDFGLARADDSADPPAASPPPLPRDAGESLPSLPCSALSNPITVVGEVMGTPGYMAPEQYDAQPTDARTDVFSFCATLWFALYGERPFAGRGLDALAEEVKRGRVKAPPKSAKVPAWVRRVLARGLAPEKEARWPSMEALIEALDADPTRAWRRVGVAVVVACAIAGVVLGVRAAGQQRARACRVEARDRVAGVWDDARKSAIERAFLATSRSYAGAAWSRAREVVDRYVDAWSAMRVEACEATRVRGEQSEQMLALRDRCLDERLDSVRALGDVLLAADAKAVEKAVQAARALDELAPCADVDQLGLSARLPSDPARRRAIDDAQREIARAKAMIDSSEETQALALLDGMRSRVDATDYGPLLAAYALQVARAQRFHDEKAAVDRFEEAILIAERHRLDRTKALAEIELGSMLGSWLGRPDEAHRWMRQASAAIARIGGDERLETKLAEEEGWAYQAEHKLSAARPLFERVLASRAAVGDPDLLASAESGLADVLSSEGKPQEAVVHAREAVRIMEASVGPHHPNVAAFLNNRAVVEMEANDVDAALETARRALALEDEQVRAGDVSWYTPHVGIAAQTLGEAWLRADRPADALEPLARAQKIYEAAHGHDHPDVAAVEVERAQALRMLGRRDEARRALDDAGAIAAKVEDAPAPLVVARLRELARLDGEVGSGGDADAAIAHAEEALRAAERAELSPREVAEVRLVLAEALWRRRRDAARSRALAELAARAYRDLRDDRAASRADDLLATIGR